MRERYFDNAATTPVDPRVLREMLPYFSESFGNANSLHSFGAKADAAVRLARERIANLIGADDPSQIYFTSGATESNNWLIRGFDRVAISPYEHSSLFESAKALGKTILSPDSRRREFDLLSVMAVNNETGEQWDVRTDPMTAGLRHADATQALGKVPFDVTGLDYASFSAHKLYGPKGVGALFVAEFPPVPLLIGGEQEGGYRSGTVNVPGIVGFGAACEIASAEAEQDLRAAEKMRCAVLDELSTLSDWKVNQGEKTSPFILNISFAEVEGETLILEADRAGYALSAGAACSSRSTEPSHVLIAMGLEDFWRRGAVRISFGRFNSLDAAVEMARTLKQSIEKLRTMSGRNKSRAT